jgi:large subunit ribosomal protein L29
MKPKVIRGHASEELHHKLSELREELFNLRFQASTEPVDNPGKVRQLKKDIARIKTILREREKELERGEAV